MKKYLLFVLVCMFCLPFACKRKPDAPVVSLDSLQNRLGVLNDSLGSRWKEMMISDDQKIADISRLLQEISYAKGHNKSLLDSVQRMAATLPGLRYTRDSVTSAQIDTYDSVTDRIVADLPVLAASIPNPDRYPLIASLLKDIQQADAQVINYRSRYETYIYEYNAIVNGYGPQLIEKDPQHKPLKIKPGFQAEPL